MSPAGGGMAFGARRFRMSMAGRALRSLATAFFLVTALSGPPVADCSSCCPAATQDDSSLRAAGCCGDPCGWTLNRPDTERAPAKVPSGSPETAAPALFVAGIVPTALVGDVAPHVCGSPPRLVSAVVSQLRL